MPVFDMNIISILHEMYLDCSVCIVSRLSWIFIDNYNTYCETCKNDELLYYITLHYINVISNAAYT